MTRKKKQEEPPEVPAYEPRFEPEEDASYSVDEAVMIATQDAVVWYTLSYDPADEVLRQIAAGKTPEGQRLTRDQMMGMAAKVLRDAGGE